MSKFVKFIVLLVISFTLPLEGFTAALPTCALMSQSYSKVSMTAQHMQVENVAAQIDKSKTVSQKSDNCCKKKVGNKACVQTAACSTCVLPFISMFNHAFAVLTTADVYLSGPQKHVDHLKSLLSTSDRPSSP